MKLCAFLVLLLGATVSGKTYNETDTRSERGLISGLSDGLLGTMECAGVDHLLHIPIFQTLYGAGVDFGGNYLCGPTCEGECVPKRLTALDAPLSLYYPFGCRCRHDRCDARGPIPTALAVPFRVTCVRDKRCTCASMGHPDEYDGYLCNWLNLKTGKIETLLDPHLSPIRWCSCCPHIPAFY